MKTDIIQLTPRMTVNQGTIAKLTGKSIATVKEWERQGWLHSTIVGGSKLFDLDEVSNLVRPMNATSRNTVLIADIPDYENFIDRIAEDVANRLHDKMSITQANKKADLSTV